MSLADQPPQPTLPTAPEPCEPVEVVEGIVDHVKLVKDDGFTVASIAVAEDKQITAIGHLLIGAHPGETLRLGGRWDHHPKHGLGFEVSACERVLPASVYAIRRYLASGLIKGIGVKLAHAVVGHFGEQTLTVIDSEPERLLEVHNIGPDRMRKIRLAWAEQKEIREVMVFLHGVGVSPALAVRIHQAFDDQALKIVREEPYKLIEKIHGIDFLTADRIALKVGVPEQGQQRLAAGLMHILDRARLFKGHCYLPERVLLTDAARLLGANITVLRPVLEYLRATRLIVAESDPRSSAVEPVVFTSAVHRAETGLAGHLIRLRTAPSQMPGRKRWLTEGIPGQPTGKSAVQLSKEQTAAAFMALTETVSVLTGGPGCGKTATVRLLARLAKDAGATVALAAPTGRAADRLSKATGMPAMTVHRMVSDRQDPGADGALFDQNDVGHADLIVVDEASMLDLALVTRLTARISSGAHLLLVGDPRQLPSIGAGNVLRDLLETPEIARVELTEIFRQSEDSTIIKNAHRVRNGLLPRSGPNFHMWGEEDPAAIPDKVAELATRRIPDAFGVGPEQVQVLCPTSKGVAGAVELNRRLQDLLNPAVPDVYEHWATGRVFRPGDKVMPIRNRYDKGTSGVFNGSSGTISRLIPDERRIEIRMEDGETVSYDHDELDELLHAYAITVHRSQGSEYPWVIIPISTQAGGLMLQRNLLYTAITRAKNHIALIGQKDALNLAVRQTGTRRHTALTRRLHDGLSVAEFPNR